MNLGIFEKNRLLILEKLLSCPDNVCGCDLREELGLPKNLLSYHLKELKELGYLEEERCGREKKYAIVNGKKKVTKHIINLIKKL